MTSFDVGIHRYLWLIIRFMFVMVPAVSLIKKVAHTACLHKLLGILNAMARTGQPRNESLHAITS